MPYTLRRRATVNEAVGQLGYVYPFQGGVIDIGPVRAGILSD